MAAVVAPISVENAYFGDGGVAPLGFGKIPAAKFEVVNGHRKRHLFVEFRDFPAPHRNEPFDNLDIGGRLGLDFERLRHFHRRLAAVNRIYEVRLRRRYFRLRKFPFQNVHARARDFRAPERDYLHALLRRVRALVELPGQVFYRKSLLALRERKRPLVNVLHGSLAKYQILDSGVNFVVQPLYVVPLQNPRGLEPLQIQIALQIAGEGARGMPAFVFYKYSANHIRRISQIRRRGAILFCRRRRFSKKSRPAQK